ncbi:hypothetical protein NUACC26_086760 [Scytonema sp. NUACC26]
MKLNTIENVMRTIFDTTASSYFFTQENRRNYGCTWMTIGIVGKNVPVIQMRILCIVFGNNIVVEY